MITDVEWVETDPREGKNSVQKERRAGERQAGAPHEGSQKNEGQENERQDPSKKKQETNQNKASQNRRLFFRCTSINSCCFFCLRVNWSRSVCVLYFSHFCAVSPFLNPADFGLFV